MGALAELVKDAEAVKDAGLADPSLHPQQFLTALEQLRERATEPTTAAADIARMEAPTEAGGFGLPSASREAKARSFKLVGKVGLGAAAIGVLLRLLRAGAEKARHTELVSKFEPYAGMPTREIRVPFAVKKSEHEKQAGLTLPLLAGTALTAPTAARLAKLRAGDILGRGAEQVRRGLGHLFATTGSPWDNPWLYPAALVGGIGATYTGYKMLDALLEKLKERRMGRELETAREEFEEALQTQYQQSELAGPTGTKYSAAGMVGFMADVLAKSHVSGELDEQLNSLTKMAQDFEPGKERGAFYRHTRGLGSKAFGLYLAALTALALTGGAAGYHFAKSRETKRKKYEAAAEYLRRRRLTRPPRVTVEPAA
ncbi:hypothetical protein LCGC14_0917710 [marine sediment metagenome]|uniref:Uncharacterized protein n=1 Tax=marine sediment metagenome TaxID=412755 RepID=A0A0F9PCF8_9ZZZZ